MMSQAHSLNMRSGENGALNAPFSPDRKLRLYVPWAQFHDSFGTTRLNLESTELAEEFRMLIVPQLNAFKTSISINISKIVLADSLM